MKDVDLKNHGAAVSKPPMRSGDRPSSRLDRLLRSAARVKDDVPVEMPFGFDTRVVALWRSNGNGTARGLARLVRRVALVATAVIILATAGSYLEVNQDRESGEPFVNEFAIADSAIQEEFLQ